MLPASQRLNAAELLKHPFFSPESAKELLRNPVQTLNLEFELLNFQKGDAVSMDMEHVSTIEFQRQNGRQEFILRGEKHDNMSISFTLRISDFCGKYLMQIKLEKLQYFYTFKIHRYINFSLF